MTATRTYTTEQARYKQEEMARYMAILDMVAIDHPEYGEDLMSVRDHLHNEWEYLHNKEEQTR